MLPDVLNREVVEDRARFFIVMLKPLGIEKGASFQPDERQRKILKEGAYVGEAMAKADTFCKRFENVQYTAGSTVPFILLVESDQRLPNCDWLDERASCFYEGCTVSKAMQGKIEGLGQAYLGAYQDKDGDWLTGGETYKLRIPPNPPARRFWCVTVYNTNTRTMIYNARIARLALETCLSMRTGRWISILGWKLPKGMKRTGSPQSGDRPGSPILVSAARRKAISREPGGCQILKKRVSRSKHYPDNDDREAAPLGAAALCWICLATGP
jgi:hypothetical protein